MARSTLSSSDFSLCLFKASEMPILPWDQRGLRTLQDTLSVAPWETGAQRELSRQLKAHMGGILDLPAPFLRMTISSQLAKNHSGNKGPANRFSQPVYTPYELWCKWIFNWESSLLLMICGSVETLNLDNHPVSSVILGEKQELSKTTGPKGPWRGLERSGFPGYWLIVQAIRWEVFVGFT